MSPKRVIHGEALYRSDKLAKVEPPRFRAEYANLLPLALANGVFEANPNKVWSDVYSYNRPDYTVADVELMLNEFERVKMLFRWREPDEKLWGFFVGIDKPGRLPGPSRQGKNEAIGPPPPMESIRKFLDSNGFHEALNGNEKLLGFGSGFGSGKTLTSNADASDQSAVEDSQTAALEQALQTVWTNFMTTIGKNPKVYTFTAKRKSMGRARLRDLKQRGGTWENAITLATLCIERLKSSPWHNGKNETGRKYLSWEILFRSTEQMEKWLDDDRWNDAKGVAS